MTMTIEIFNVGHGACSVITSPNGRRLMIDCGHDADQQWWPSIHYYGQSIEELVVSNYDEDHVSDLVDLMKNVKLSYISLNLSVSTEDLGYLKMETGMGPGIERLKSWMATVTGKPSSGTPQFDPMIRTFFYNQYPNDFDDENNLSVVTFVEWSGFRIIYPGDLEAAGWRLLLRRSDFRKKLERINVFVASHHGRDSGCCEGVFEVCKPQIVVMSDRDKQFDSQETTQWYANRCVGIRYNGQNRYVFTTRNDGDIKITVGPSTWQISTSK